jgi:hypothetical protein
LLAISGVANVVSSGTDLQNMNVIDNEDEDEEEEEEEEEEDYQPFEVSYTFLLPFSSFYKLMYMLNENGTHSFKGVSE